MQAVDKLTNTEVLELDHEGVDVVHLAQRKAVSVLTADQGRQYKSISQPDKKVLF